MNNGLRIIQPRENLEKHKNQNYFLFYNDEQIKKINHLYMEDKYDDFLVGFEIIYNNNKV